MVIEALPKTETLEFIPPHEFGLTRLAEYYRQCRFDVCEYTLGIKLMCEELYHYAFAEVHGCLVCRDEYDGKIYFDYPIAGSEGADVDAAIEEIERYCLEADLPLRWTTLPPEVLGTLLGRYDGARVYQTYYCTDYFYRTEDLCGYEGKKYAGQRNHVRRFRRACPNAIFRPITPADRPLLDRFFARFYESFPRKDEESVQEMRASAELLTLPERDLFRRGCMELDGEIIGVAVGEKCGDTLVEHVEKALAADYEGIYPAMLSEFVRLFGADCRWVNREDDAMERGLRNSKLQYHPVRLAQKFDVDIENILHLIDEIPTIETERLILDAITQCDVDAYGALCLDDAHNRYWGYDYRADLGGETPDGAYFCRVATEDFSDRRAINFAVRKNGTFVGEVVLYRFDNRGSAEIGFRILPAYTRRGYAKEASEAVLDWALYTLGMTSVRAKCFAENASSRKILEKLMRKTDERHGMLYFERRI